MYGILLNIFFVNTVFISHDKLEQILASLCPFFTFMYKKLALAT